MDSDSPIRKFIPKGEVLREAARRYPDLDMDALEVVLAIKGIAAGWDCANQDSLEALGVSEGKFYLICYVFSEELLGHDPPSPSEIADHLGVTRATITGLLDGLERDGYLARHDNDRDRRALVIRLTEKARALLDSFIPAQAAKVGAFVGQLTADERQTLMALLAKLMPALT